MVIFKDFYTLITTVLICLIITAAILIVHKNDSKIRNIEDSISEWTYEIRSPGFNGVVWIANSYEINDGILVLKDYYKRGSQEVIFNGLLILDSFIIELR